MVLLCVEGNHLYEDPNFTSGHYGVCDNCNKRLVSETPELMFREFKKMFDSELSRNDVKKLIVAGLRELNTIKPLGQPKQSEAQRLPKSRRIDLGLNDNRHNNGHRKG